jgi:hypothetical protein
MTTMSPERAARVMLPRVHQLEEIEEHDNEDFLCILYFFRIVRGVHVFIAAYRVQSNLSSLAMSYCGKRVLFGIYCYNYFDDYVSVFVPERSRAGTNPLSQFLYQHGHVLVQKLKYNCQNNCKSKFRRRHVYHMHCNTLYFTCRCVVFYECFFYVVSPYTFQELVCVRKRS